MNLYYLNQEVNSLRFHAKVSAYARWKLGELLHEADQSGYLIEQNKETGEILISGRRGDVNAV